MEIEIIDKNAEREEIDRLMREYEEDGGGVEKVRTRSHEEIIAACKSDIRRSLFRNYRTETGSNP